MTKRLICFCLSLLLMLACTACGRKPVQPTTVPAPAATEAPATVPVTEAT